MKPELPLNVGSRLLFCVVLTALVGCPPPALLPKGCSKDVDCKGARVCVAHSCVDPAPPLAPSATGEVTPSPVVIAPSTPAPPTPSPQFHIDAMHTGRSRYHAPSSAPTHLSRISTGGVVYSSVSVAADGTLVFGSHDHYIYGYRPDFTPAWKMQTRDLVWGTAAIQNGIAYIGSDDDSLYAIDARTGAPQWQFQAGPCRRTSGPGPEASRCDVDGVTVAPDGTIYAAADGLYALTPAGTLKWKFAAGATGKAHCHSTPAVGADGTVYLGCQDDTVYAIDASGAKKWEFRTGDDVDSSPAIGADGTIYVGSDDRKLYAFQPGGGLKFSVLTGGSLRASPAIGADGTIYIGSFDSSLYAISPNGVTLWTFRTADRILSSPTIDADGIVLFGSEDDRLYALSAAGKLLWSVVLDGDVDSTPTILADGTIVVGADDRALHVLRP